ncbi:membrane integrity-associated transporter subunit PqiC [candidate division KSB1 bacterium]|nr:membrane integrity-associated transporter subunit PqiC [candidate division KSB1 bacterium]
MKFKFLCLVIAVLLVPLACGKKINTRRYYVLECTGRSPQARPDTALFNVKVDVRDFRVARAFDQTRMTLRTNTNELDYYFYHHWAVKPSLAVADFVYDVIEARNMFSGNVRGISYNPDYIIQGDIKSLERLQEDNMAFTHVHMAIELINARTEKTVVQYEEDQRLALEPVKSMNTFAGVTSQILMHFTDKFIEQVQGYLQAQPPGGR